MTEIENKIKNYIDNYFTMNELKIMKKQYKHDYGHSDAHFNDIEYNQLTAFYRKLLNITDNRYRIEINDSGAALTQTLFERYVSNDTFIVAVLESHISLNERINALDKHRVFYFCAGAEEHKDKNLPDKIIDAYNKSGCKNMFIMLVRVVPGFSYILEQSLLEEIKRKVTINKIPHIFILDDCQGIFNLPCNYEMFDAILATAHTLFPGFHMGILFTKLKEQIGFVNKTGLKRFTEKLEILVKHKNKANQFQDLLTEYFKPMLNDKFKVAKNTAPQHFTMLINDSKLIKQYSDELFRNYNFVFCEQNAQKSWFRIRYYEIIIQKSDHILRGLRLAKHYMKKLTRYNELDEIKLDNTNSGPYMEYNDMFDVYFNIEKQFYNYKDPEIIMQEKKNLEKIFKQWIRPYSR